MELKPGRQPNTTRVIFETEEELYLSSRFCGLVGRTLIYFGLGEDPMGVKPLAGATVREDGLILPSETSTPLHNARLAQAATRLFKDSVTSYYCIPAANGQFSINNEGVTMANQIVEYLNDLEQVQSASEGEPSLEFDPPSFIGRS